MAFLEHAKKVHIVGAGGIGISALARLLHDAGKDVSGCDRNASELGEALSREGITVSVGHAVEHVSADTNALIYSDAVSAGSSGYLERERAESLGIPTLSYFAALGEVTNGYDLIAVAGTHGKTTTTAMLADILEEAKLDPTVVVGSIRSKTGSNFRSGGGRYFLLEADEYMRHFLYLSPKVLVITNIDRDHLDYYKDLEDIQGAFRELAQKVPADGFIITDVSHPHVIPVLEGVRATVIDYKDAGEIPKLKFPGEHNVANARAVLSAARALGVSDEVALPALSSFAGTARRFEYKGETSVGAFVYDDYAHNPPKVRAALKGTRQEFPERRIVAVFQPHLYSRTKLLLSEFSESFVDADEVIVLPIYAAREQDDGSISSEILAKEIQKHGSKVSPLSFVDAEGYLKDTLGSNDIVLTLGAGEAYRVGDALLATS